MKSHSDQENEITQLLLMAKTRLPLLSFKVYGVQSQTQKIATELRRNTLESLGGLIVANST